MKFTYGKLKTGEYAVGQDIEVADVQEIEVPDDHPTAPHKYVTHLGEGCAICGRPESAGRHHYEEVTHHG